MPRNDEDTMLGSWLFEVFVDENDNVYTEFSILDNATVPGEAQWSKGEVPGPLDEAVPVAYAVRGLVCPLIPDPDLLGFIEKGE